MNLPSLSRAFARIARPFRLRTDARHAGGNYAGLARRIEERSLLVSLEGRAYVDHRINALGTTPAETGRHIERRAQLAAQEAKAYADGAAESLASALRGMSHTIVRLSRRVDELERGLAVLQGGVLASRAGQLADEVAALSRQLDDAGIEPEERRRIDRVDAALRTLADDLAGAAAETQGVPEREATDKGASREQRRG